MLKMGNNTYDPIISECRLLIQKMSRIVIKQNNREQNGVADLLANKGARKKLFGKLTMLVVPPMYANKVF